ncbi:uncharacterized [Tachysurus ichikawai]
MLIRLPFATGYLGNSVSSHQFPTPSYGIKEGKGLANSHIAPFKDKRISDGSLSSLLANIHTNYSKHTNGTLRLFICQCPQSHALYLPPHGMAIVGSCRFLGHTTSSPCCSVSDRPVPLSHSCNGHRPSRTLSPSSTGTSCALPVIIYGSRKASLHHRIS